MLTPIQAMRKECVRLYIEHLKQTIQALETDFNDNNSGQYGPEAEAYEDGPHKEFCAAVLSIGKREIVMATMMYDRPEEFVIKMTASPEKVREELGE